MTNKKQLRKSHTVQFASILLLATAILSLPEVQVIIPDVASKYVTAILAILAIIRKYLQE